MKNLKRNISFFLPCSPQELEKRILGLKSINLKPSAHIHKYCYILDSIYLESILSKSSKGKVFNSRLLRENLGSYYSTILNHLIRLQLIETDNSYKIGKYSKCYKLVDGLTFSGYIVEVPFSFKNKFYSSKSDGSENALGTQLEKRIFRSMSRLEINNDIRKDLSEKENRLLFLLKEKPYQRIGQKSNRIFNNFANLPKTLRKLLTLNNEPLFFIDICNSQLVFLAVYIRKELEKFKIEESTNIFFNLVEKGNLYESLMSSLRVDSRDSIKKDTFTFLFGPNWMKNKVSNYFREEFPQVFGIIEKVKEVDHTKLAQKMQQLEAKLIFETVNSLPDELDVLTIHDSIYCANSNKHLILNALVNQFKELGVTAKLNVNDQFSVETNLDSNYYSKFLFTKYGAEKIAS